MKGLSATLESPPCKRLMLSKARRASDSNFGSTAGSNPVPRSMRKAFLLTLSLRPDPTSKVFELALELFGDSSPKDRGSPQMVGPKRRSRPGRRRLQQDL